MTVVLSVQAASGWLAEYARCVRDQAAALTELDRAIGDADHGSNLDRGMQAVAALEAGADAGGLCTRAGMTLVSSVGGASGPLYGTFFLRLGSALSAGADVAAAFRAGVDGVAARGRARAGDKTMLDALLPAADALATGGEGGGAWERAADAAEAGRDATIPLVARKGRASYLGERSVGHQDPGATSAALLVRCAARTLP